MRTIVTALILCAAAALPAANADDRIFRCGGSIIDIGLTIPQVLARCGEPESRDVSILPVRARNLYRASIVVGAASIEYWVYQRRGGQFPVYLTFDQGRLRRIEFLHRR